MKAILGLGFVLLGSLLLVNGGLLGGEHDVEDENSETIQKVKDFIKKDVKPENGYTKATTSDWQIKQQVVAGILYNCKWKTTSTSGASSSPVVKTCSASVWQKPYANAALEYAKGKEPKCQ